MPTCSYKQVGNDVSNKFLHFSRFCAHESVELVLFREVVLERHEVRADFDEAVAGTDIGDIRELFIGYAEELGKLLPVGRRLVQHYDELRV